MKCTNCSVWAEEQGKSLTSFAWIWSCDRLLKLPGDLWKILKLGPHFRTSQSLSQGVGHKVYLLKCLRGFQWADKFENPKLKNFVWN